MREKHRYTKAGLALSVSLYLNNGAPLPAEPWLSEASDTRFDRTHEYI